MQGEESTSETSPTDQTLELAGPSETSPTNEILALAEPSETSPTNETVELTEQSETSATDETVELVEPSENEEDDEKKIEDVESVQTDSDTDKLTDVSLGDDEDEEVTHFLPGVPNINVVSDTDTSDDDTAASDSSKIVRKKREELQAQLDDTNSRLDEEIKKSELLRHQLQQETDARERVESNLSELGEKYKKQLKEEEELRDQLHKKDELCTALQAKELELVQELVNLKKESPGSVLQRSEFSTNNHSHNELILLNDKLKYEISELQSEYDTSRQLLTTKNTYVETLEKQIEDLKNKFDKYENEKAEEQDKIKKVQDASANEAKVQAQIQVMVEQVIDNSQKKMCIKMLEEEVASLKGTVEENKEKYNLKYNEALATLQEVQHAYGEMRDVVLEGYKQEIATLNERVRIAEEKSNEDIITGLRQELLDARLQQERSKQMHKDEIEVHAKNLSHSVSKVEELLTELKEMKLEVESEKERNVNTENSLQRTQKLANERKQKISELNSQINLLNESIQSMKVSIVEKDGLVCELRNQLVKEAEILTKEHTEKENLQVEIEMMESIKRQNQRLEEEIEEMCHKIKLRGTKIKFLKKHIKELEEQKQKAETLMLVIPEMQKKIDELTEEKEKMKRDIIHREQEERENIRKAQQEKREEEERIHKEKEEWEKSILGIGKCLELHEGKEHDNSGFVRPNSAPLMKPRPPASRRHTTKNHKSNGLRAPTLNPVFLNSYPEGRKATQKMKQHQEKIILSNQTRDNLFRCVTRPMSYSTASFKHVSDGKYLPNIPAKSREDFVPRVLVWGNDDGPGNKMVAVGDRVLTNLHSACSMHGESSKQQPGIVKFIGFVDGNDEDVYIGLRLEEEVGYTDGTIQGKRYFRSEPEKGAFVHLNDIVKVLQSQMKHVPTLSA